MSQVAKYREKRHIVAKQYAPGGCPINVGKQKCGETQGLDIIMDFHKLYQEKMNEIDVSAGGDSLQEKMDLQEQWISDLTEQNKLLAMVIEELESETIGKVQQLEDKLNNAVKSLGEVDKKAEQEEEKGTVELEGDSSTLPAVEENLKKKSEENEHLKQPGIKSEQEIRIHSMSKPTEEPLIPCECEPSKTPETTEKTNEDIKTQILKSSEETSIATSIPQSFVSDQTEEGEESGQDSRNKTKMLSKVSSKSVHLMVEKDNVSRIFEPEKDLSKISEMPEPPTIDILPVFGTHDSVELLIKKSPHVSEKNLHKISDICDENGFLAELDKLKEENKMLRDGTELRRLKGEVEEKMKRILELNEENRTLNDMINILRKNHAAKNPKGHSSDSGPSSSDSDYCPGGCQPPRTSGKTNKKRISNKENKNNNIRETENNSLSCKGKKSPPLIDVYKLEDKGKFISDSSSTVCNEELCPVLNNVAAWNNQNRARGGNDTTNPCPAETFPNCSNILDECYDNSCPYKDVAIPVMETIDTIAATCNDIPLLCGNKSCQTEGCESFQGELGSPKQKCTVGICCLNTTCGEEEQVIGLKDFAAECSDVSCPNKDLYDQTKSPGAVSYELTNVKQQPESETPQELPQDANINMPASVATVGNTPIKCDNNTCLVTDCVGKGGSMIPPGSSYATHGLNDAPLTDIPVKCDNNTCLVTDCIGKGGNLIPPDSTNVTEGFKNVPPGETQTATTESFATGPQIESRPTEKPDLPIQYAFAPQGVPKTPSICICAMPEECQRDDAPSGIEQQAIVGPKVKYDKCPKGYCKICTCLSPPTDEGAEEEQVCAICGCKLTPDDIMKGKTCDVGVDVMATTNTQDPSATKEGVCVCEGRRIGTVDTSKEPHISDQITSVPPAPAFVSQGLSEKPSAAEPSIQASEKVSAIPSEHPVNEIPLELVDEKPSTTISEKPSGAVDEKPSTAISDKPSEIAEPPTTISEKPSEAVDEKPSTTIPENSSAAVDEQPSTTTPENPSTAVDGQPSTTIPENPSAEVDEKPSSTIPENLSTVADEKPSTLISEIPTEAVDQHPATTMPDQPAEAGDEKPFNAIPVKLEPEEESPTGAALPPSGDDRTVRCICKSKFCKVIPDPNNPNQNLCVDVSDTELKPRSSTCVCEPVCPNTPDEKGVDMSQLPQYQKVVTVNQLYGMPKTPESLSKEQEYAGLSRKDSLGRRIGYIPPRKASSKYGIKDDDDKDFSENEEMKNADLKLVIAELKSKLLDAEDKMEELKAAHKYNDFKDNDSILINKYSQEINEMKKSLKWSKKEREEYEYLKQKVKLLEQGKGDTENITSNLQTAEEKIVIRNQLKKLTKKNKCYEEVVQFFKDEMSVMSDELLTLQEVLNVTSVSSQEENNKLIGAILQLRRINDRLVGHLCAIEKQAILESQINQINEARIDELQNIISAKNNDLNQHDDIIQDMRRKLDNTNRQNADLKKTIKNLTDTVVEIQEGIKSVERDQMKNLTDASLVESRVCIANGDLEAIKTCMQQKNIRIADLENQLKSQEVDFVLATNELKMLKEKKHNSKEVINSLKEQISIAEKKNEQVMGDYQVVVKKLQDYSSIEHMKNYELNHYKALVEEMKMSLVQLNNGLEKCEASNIHFYEDLRNSDHQRGHLQHRKNDLPIVFDELKKSMADLKRRLSEADFKGGLIEEELLKVRESHMSQIREEATDARNELESRIISSIEDHSRLNQLVEEQKEEIQRLKKEMERERADTCCCKRSVSELKNEKTSSNAEMEISQLKCELNKSLHRQRLLNEENDQIHTQMINLRKKLSMLEQAYDVLKQENEEYKLQLKRAIREKEYLTHKNHEMVKTIEQMRSSHDQLEKQCRTIMKQMSEEKSWTKTPMQQPFSQRRYGTVGTVERRAASPIKTRKMERHTADVNRYRSSSPWRDINAYANDEYHPEDTNSHKSNIMRNISYDSNSSPYTSRSPSPRSNSIQGEEDELDDLNLNDWFSPNYKETDTDADDVDDDEFISKVQLMTAQVQEANKRWQKKMNKEHFSKSRANKK